MVLDFLSSQNEINLKLLGRKEKNGELSIIAGRKIEFNDECKKQRKKKTIRKTSGKKKKSRPWRWPLTELKLIKMMEECIDYISVAGENKQTKRISYCPSNQKS